MANILSNLALIFMAITIILIEAQLHLMQKTIHIQNMRITSLVEKIEELKTDK
ncbi:MAG: hypothetical protein K6F00_08415 [Lachnospiraceae bacterium]|nr:hypothetical protein [Lachnospiraceae bacterium]